MYDFDPDFSHEFFNISDNNDTTQFTASTSPQPLPKTQTPFIDLDTLQESHLGSTFSSYSSLLNVEQQISPVSSIDDNWYNAATSENYGSDDSLPPSPTKPNGFHQDVHSSKCLNIKAEAGNMGTGFDFEEWKVHDHLRPDGTCKCPKKKKPSKCVVLKCEFTITAF